MNGVLDAIAAGFYGLMAALGLFQPASTSWNGYLEADYVYVAPLTSGRITAIHADQGDHVAASVLLVEMDTEAQQAALAAAKAGVAQAQANLDNLETGSRDAEIAVIEANLRKAEADRDLAKDNLDRTKVLTDKGTASAVQLQQMQSQLAVAQAQVDQLQAQLEVARLPARAAQRNAAEAALNVARFQAQSAQVALRDRSLTAPITGVVDQRFFNPGEVAGAGTPILSLYDPAKLKVIFFVPEARRAALALGQALTVTCDGCPSGLQAEVTRIAPEPQFTPPILYSRDERGRLVFRAEARMSTTEGLSPGQPVSLTPRP
jgi:HlyD family secretion protein